MSASKFDPPKYNYAENIKSPLEMNMGQSGDLMAKNVSGLMAYVELLTIGGGDALKGSSLGNRYFVNAGSPSNPAKCLDSRGNSVLRSLYVDNIASGKFAGLVSSIGDTLKDINVNGMMSAFTDDSDPSCKNIHTYVTGPNGEMITGSGFVVDSEIKLLNPCSFISGTNPITLKTCSPEKESFVNANMKIQRGMKIQPKKISFKNKPLANIYTATLGGLMIYILYKLTYEK
jgi:hypothetical protein